jgi:hypothetical protein
MFKSKKAFLLLYAIIWVLVLISPYFRYMQDVSPNGWNRMIGDWTNLFLLLLLFLINLFVLVPRLLFNDKRSQYFFIVTTMIFAVAVISLIVHPTGPPQPPGREISPEDMQTGRPLDILPLLGTILNNLIAAFLIIGSSTALELEYKWRSEQKLRKDAEKEQLRTNLALLRHQVSPHFFMNTLNNIHALVEIDSGKAQDAIERLSILMRYLLYDSAQSNIELKKEIEFINSFVSLMQLRHSDEVEVKIRIPDQIPDIKIPPMLFISLLENAFKHGVSYPMSSYIYFELQIHQNTLVCNIKNSKHQTVVNQFDEYSGIGLENIKKSLNLLYEKDYKLDVSDKEHEFEVNLIIPV